MMVFTSSSSNLSPLAPPFTVDRPSVTRSSTIPLVDLPDSFYLPVDRPSSNSYFPLNNSITIRHPDSDPLLPLSLDYSSTTPPEIVSASTTPTAPSSDYASKLKPSTDLKLGFYVDENNEFSINTDAKGISNTKDSNLFVDEDGVFDVEKGDRDDESINLVEDSPCWIPRFLSHAKQNNEFPVRFNEEMESSAMAAFLSHAKQNNEFPLRFNQEMESSAMAASSSGNEASPVPTTTNPLSYDASTNTLKAKTLVSSLCNLSDLVINQLSELREEDCDALKLVIRKLSACVQSKTGRPVVPQSPKLFDKVFEEMRQQEEATQAIKKIVAESLRFDEAESSQERLYKNLWLEAEAAQFFLTYKNRFTRTKMELEKYENEARIGKNFIGINEMATGATNYSTVPGDDSVRFSENEESIWGKYSILQNYGRKEDEEEDSVMARLQILKQRDQMLI